jgi:hypothetical protein
MDKQNNDYLEPFLWFTAIGAIAILTVYVGLFTSIIDQVIHQDECKKYGPGYRYEGRLFMTGEKTCEYSQEQYERTMEERQREKKRIKIED